MISEIIPEAYDFFGKKISKPTGKRIRVFHPTFPMGRYLSQPLTHRFTSIDELRRFLFTCTYVSDEEQFGKSDYWLPPEAFEICKQGDCEDFALYAWRQLIAMGITARFVVGVSGRYGDGHAWVTMEQGGKQYLLEPLACLFNRLPRLSMLRYTPEISVETVDGKIAYFSHRKLDYNPSLLEGAALFGEWLNFWLQKCGRLGILLMRFPFRLLKRMYCAASRSAGKG
jgi:hypothetical protein